MNVTVSTNPCILQAHAESGEIAAPLHLLKPLDDFGLFSCYPGEEKCTKSSMEPQDPQRICLPSHVGAKRHIEDSPRTCNSPNNTSTKTLLSLKHRLGFRRRSLANEPDAERRSDNERLSSPPQVVAFVPDNILLEEDDDISAISQSDYYADLDGGDNNQLFIGDDFLQDEGEEENGERLFSWYVDVQSTSGECLGDATPWFRLFKSKNEYVMLEGIEIIHCIQALVGLSEGIPLTIHVKARGIAASTMLANEALHFFSALLAPAPSSSPREWWGDTEDRLAESYVIFLERFIDNFVAPSNWAGGRKGGYCASFESSSSFPLDLICDYE